MRATIAYYDPPRRPAPEARPDFTSLPLAGKPVTVSDMRAAGGGFSLDREGFTLADAPTEVRDFYDRAEMAGRYVAEARDLVRSLTGCTATALLNSPVVRVSGRVGTRPAGTTQDVPLALCDVRSVAPQDKQYCEITMKSALGDVLTWENITYYHNAAHRWWFSPDMTRDEAYVFRSFDSAPGHAEQVPHSAFVNESCPASAQPRASVEVRVLAFYADQ